MATFSKYRLCIAFDKKTGWATFWAIFSQTKSGHPGHAAFQLCSFFVFDFLTRLLMKNKKFMRKEIEGNWK
jgi:hypothetical protein